MQTGLQRQGQGLELEQIRVSALFQKWGTEARTVNKRLRDGPEDHSAGESERPRGDSNFPLEVPCGYWRCKTSLPEKELGFGSCWQRGGK